MTLDRQGILSAKPFNLDDEAVWWVGHHLDTMSLDDKIGQLFILMLLGDDPTAADRIAHFRPAGVTRFFGADLEAEVDLMDQLRRDAAIPLLFPADTEGSRMSLSFGTQVPNPLAMAAIDDDDAQVAVCEIMAREVTAMGANISFTPVIDICAEPRSAIVPTRSFGTDQQRIARLARLQVEVLQSNGVAATAKHWPGDGYDARDQHLLTTINPLSMVEWHETFGRLYSEMIDAGVMAVMSAHIALPAYIAAHDPDAGVELYRPACVNKLLNRSLLRDELGFNGVIISDASGMAGLSSWDHEDVTKAELIENGCDIILFSDDAELDRARIKAALEDGRLSYERLEEAVTRTLGLKAALGLHEELPAVDTSRLASSKDASTARAITARAPTLVKDVRGMLPLSAERHRRLYVYSTGVVSPITGVTEFAMLDMLRAEGFEVTLHEAGYDLKPWAGHDAVLYLLGEESLLTRQNIFLNWAELGGSFLQAMMRPFHDLPTALISFGHPFYLTDAPRVPCAINAYATIDPMQEAVVDCLVGRAPFLGTSPVDPTGGVPDALY